MCGSADLLKQDGVFVCQNCSTKYSVEEARKMMVEGTVRIDNSEKIAKYYQLARTAKEEDDSKTAAKYYGLIREEDPESWEAKFYSIYYEAIECKVAEAYSMCVKLEKIASSILSSIKNNEPKDKQAECVLEVASKINDIALMFLNGNSEEATGEAPNLVIIWGDHLEEKYPDVSEITEQAASFWENALSVLIDTYGIGEEKIDNTVEKYSKKIQKYNRNYVVPKSNISVHTSTSPNKATVEILKIGHIEEHTDFTTLPSVLSPVLYIASGPDSADGISVELRLKNIKGKTIKYATLYVTAFDQVGSPAACTIHQEATRALSITGPIEAGQDSGELIFETIWYNPTITSVRMHSMLVEYTDGSKEKYKHDEFILGVNTVSNAKPDEQLATLTVTLNDHRPPLAANEFITCILDSKEAFQLTYMETVTIPVKHGHHKISFEFKGQSRVPAKCQSTPEFVVAGDTTIELKIHKLWGGFKTNIIK